MFTQFPIAMINPRPHLLKINNKYSIYLEESGNPKGIPMLFVRGGPGCSPNIKEHAWFNPEKYRIIIFDQRGSGRCEPTAEKNYPEPNYYADITVDDLISDMEHIRRHLNIETWCLFGGSWGATLALRYAQLNPQRIQALILRGIFLCTQDEMKIYFNLTHLKNRFPEFNAKALSALIDHANAQLNINLTYEDEKNLLAAYQKLIIQKNDAKAMYLWSEFENYMDDFAEEKLHKLLNPPREAEVSGESRCQAIFQTLLFPQLSDTNCLLQPTHLSKLTGLKIFIVHGKQDSTCPMEYAITLERMLQAHHAQVKMILVDEGKHTPYSASMMHELIKITNEWDQDTKSTYYPHQLFAHASLSQPQLLPENRPTPK